MGLSNFVSKEACPRCRSFGKDTRGDNMAVYDDGHKHCFGCGYWIPSNKVVTGVTKEINKVIRVVPLPDDADVFIDARALTWLSLYDIEAKELETYHILWSKSREYLIFPIYDDLNNLLMWQARCFREKAPNKWLTFGSPAKVVPWELTGDLNRGIILVEDVISAIKVQRQYPCVPLFGSYLSPERLTILKFFSDRLLIWLDYDKRADAVAYATLAQSMGFSAKLAVTEQDPKWFNNHEIKEIVDEVLPK